MASDLVRLGIPGIALLLSALFVAGVYAAERRVFTEVRARRHALVALLGIVGFLSFLAALALTGLLGRFDLRPPPLMLWMAATLGSAIALGLSPLGKRLASLPLIALVGFQAFRLPLELVMHRAASDGVMPSIMSYGGYNFDIVSGATALVLGLALLRGSVPRVVIVAWNVLGSVLLANIVTVAFLATPLVRAFGESQINAWITQFPYSWMAVMVGMALLGHLVLARRLMAESRQSSQIAFDARRCGSNPS